MKHMTEAAIEILVAMYPQPIELSAVERIVKLAWPDAYQEYLDGRPWWSTLARAGLIETAPWETSPVSRYMLTDEGWAMCAYTRQRG